MITPKSARKQATAIKDAVVDRIDHITDNEKLAGAAVIGLAVGAAATVIGSAILHNGSPEIVTKATKKPVA